MTTPNTLNSTLSKKTDSFEYLNNNSQSNNVRLQIWIRNYLFLKYFQAINYLLISNYLQLFLSYSWYIFAAVSVNKYVKAIWLHEKL